MAAYLADHPPVRDQWYATRRLPLTGCTVLHTAESVMDTVGPDTGAEAVAEFIRTRTTPGSYHDLCDSDTAIYLVDYSHGAYHDATGSNNWALSISWACATTDWDRMTPEKRRAFLRQGAIAFARQQAWRKAHGYPLTELRLITKAQSDAGVSGFTYHGYRDPGRRSDPGVAPPDDFPFAEFITECRAAMSGDSQEDDMDAEQNRKLDYIYQHMTPGTAGVKHHGKGFEALIGGSLSSGKAGEWPATWGYNTVKAMSSQIAVLTAAFDKLADAVATGDGLDAEELKAAMREVMAEVVKVQVSVEGPESDATQPATA